MCGNFWRVRLQVKVCHLINFQLFTEAKNNFDVSANHIRSTATKPTTTPTTTTPRTTIAKNEWLQSKQRTKLKELKSIGIATCDVQMSIN